MNRWFVVVRRRQWRVTSQPSKNSHFSSADIVSQPGQDIDMNMSKKYYIKKFFKNYKTYFKSVMMRLKQKKKDKEEDPFIYPHY